MPLSPLAHLSSLLLPLLLTSSIILPSNSHQIQFVDSRLIDHIIGHSAFLSFPNHHNIKTAILYHVNLPPTLPGVTADTVRFRTGSLRRHGAKTKNFRFAPGSDVIVRPHMTRLVVVFQNLGNTYSSVYNVSGFRLVTPILGLLVYDATNIGRNLSVFVKKQPILVNFSGLVGETRGKLMCAEFLLDGEVRLSNLTETDTCIAWGQGHFGLVVSSETRVGRWKVGLMMAVGGAFVAVLLGLVAVAMVKVKRKRGWIAEMERRAYEEEALQMSMVGHVRAPTATLARTTPALENDYYPCL